MYLQHYLVPTVDRRNLGVGSRCVLSLRLHRREPLHQGLAKDTATHNKYRAAMAEAVQMRDEERIIAAPSVAAAVQTTAAATAPASLAQPPKPPPPPPKTKPPPPPPPPRQRVLPGAPPRLDVAAAHPTTSATPALASSPLPPQIQAPPGIQPQLNLQRGDFAHAAGHQHHHLSEPPNGATTASSGSAASSAAAASHGGTRCHGLTQCRCQRRYSLLPPRAATGLRMSSRHLQLCTPAAPLPYHGARAAALP